MTVENFGQLGKITDAFDNSISVNEVIARTDAALIPNDIQGSDSCATSSVPFCIV